MLRSLPRKLKVITLFTGFLLLNIICVFRLRLHRERARRFKSVLRCRTLANSQKRLEEIRLP